MALSEPVERQLLHTRRVDCRGYRRADGLFDVEATIEDSKTYAFENHWRGTVVPGDPVHLMRLRLTVDEHMTIRAAEAETLKSPYAICGDAAPGVAALVGLRIGPGWMRQVKARYGGAKGCTHILELLYPVATTAYQTIFPWKERERRLAGEDEATAIRQGPPLDSCWAFSTGRDVVRRLWPEKYTGPA
jgi:hypothetical protein